MNFPSIDISTLPGLQTAQALFGSITPGSANYDDSVVEIMVYVYNVIPHEVLG